jgi:hypothetical protein
MKSEALTNCTFTAKESVWRHLDTWAKARGYRLIDWHAESRVYEKPHRIRRNRGCWVVSIDEVGRDVHVAGSIRPMRLTRLRPRRAANDDVRRDVERLLRSLTQEPPG